MIRWSTVRQLTDNNSQEGDKSQGSSQNSPICPSSLNVIHERVAGRVLSSEISLSPTLSVLPLYATVPPRYFDVDTMRCQRKFGKSSLSSRTSALGADDSVEIYSVFFNFYTFANDSASGEDPTVGSSLAVSRQQIHELEREVSRAE